MAQVLPQSDSTAPLTQRLSYRSWAKTDLGRHRAINEDAFFCDEALALFVVADGMGGHAAGEIASAEAVETVFGMVKRGMAALGDVNERLTEVKARAVCRVMEGAIQAATYMVFAMAELERDKTGMGTTISAILGVGPSMVIGQVGDSRIYRFRDGVITQLTEDHTLVAWEIKQGILTEEEAKTAPHRNLITRAVGNKDYVEVDTAVFGVERGDRFLLCSDGLHGYLEGGELAARLQGPGNEVVQSLIELANERGGRDNITAVLVEVA